MESLVKVVIVNVSCTMGMKCLRVTIVISRYIVSVVVVVEVVVSVFSLVTFPTLVEWIPCFFLFSLLLAICRTKEIILDATDSSVILHTVTSS